MYDSFDGLIFDMDGTLVDSGQLHEQAWAATFARFNIPMDRPLMRSLAGMPTLQTIIFLHEHFGLNPVADVALMHEFKEDFVAREMHNFVKPTALDKIVQEYYGRKPMAVGTGAQTAEARKILALCGLAQYFPVVVGADQVRAPKPAPDTFLRCAELLGVEPSRCVVFEDAKLGLMAAAAGGMAAVDVLVAHQITNDYFL